jgi:hypothetical protein
MTGASFWMEVTRRGAAPCWACALWPGDKGKCEHRSAGHLDAHHLIRKALLKVEFPRGARRPLSDPRGVPVWEASPRGWESEPGWDTMSLDQIVWDPRNGVPVGRWHHDQLEARRLVIPRALLPAPVEAFAAELELGRRLDHDYGCIVIPTDTGRAA